MSRFRLTVRVRLAVVLGLLLATVGAAVLGLNLLLVRRRLAPEIERRVVETSGSLPSQENTAPALEQAAGADLQDSVVDTTLDALTTQSLIALLVMSGVSIVIGWVAAARLLRPVHQITDTARRLSVHNLDERIGLRGPDDELKELADTFDAMLDRLDRAFAAQRRFVANASHQLRTPLAITRSAVDVVAAKPDRRPADVDRLLEEVRDATIRSEELIAGLLVLARADLAEPDRAPVDLAALVATEIERFEAIHPDRRFTQQLVPAVIEADAVLLRELVHNLLDNATKHGTGEVSVSVATEELSGTATITIGNGGPVLDPATVEQLFEPFGRGQIGRSASTPGTGLGLSIARAISERHGATITAHPRSNGGLDIAVTGLPHANPTSRSPRRLGDGSAADAELGASGSPGV